MTVSLNEILAAAQSHAAPLAAESAGYLLLAVADHVAVAPRLVAAEDVELFHDGSVRLRSRPAPDVARAEHAVRGLLGRTLEVSSSVGPALRRAAERREETGLAALVRELEVALIPVNRGAARRALSRLHRETERARDAGKLTALLQAAPVVAAAPAVAASPVAAPITPPEPAPAPVPAPPSAELSEPAPVVLPAVAAVPPTPRPIVKPAPVVELTLTPEPRRVDLDPAVTRPEPVVQRARERGSSTPRLGTVVTAQTLPGEEVERTERAPHVAIDEAEASPVEIDIEVDVDVDVDVEEEASTPLRALAVETQPLVDPEPSRLPDVLSAMLELHTGLDADEAPTRLREVVTELLAIVQPVPLLTPEPQPVDELETPISLVEVAPRFEPPPVVAIELPDPVDTELHEALTWNPAPVAVDEPEPPTQSFVYRFESERAAPELHEALTWYPAPVTANESPLPPEMLIAEPSLEPSPYAPAVLPGRSSDVSELVDAFYVSGQSEERELRSALKEMAGLDLTPMPLGLLGRR